MSLRYFDLCCPEHAYVFGLLQADAHHSTASRNRGKISLELAIRDSDIIYAIANLIKVNTSIRTRVRNTNFKSNYATITMCIFDYEFRREMLALGLPIGKKSLIVRPPEKYAQCDYWRGVIDGNGSLGLTAAGYPFLSLTTNSDQLKESYCKYISQLTGDAPKEVHRNKRDNIYNIAVYKESAKIVVDTFYYDGCLALKRKKEKASMVHNWIRPTDMRKRS